MQPLDETTLPASGLRWHRKLCDGLNADVQLAREWHCAFRASMGPLNAVSSTSAHRCHYALDSPWCGAVAGKDRGVPWAMIEARAHDFGLGVCIRDLDSSILISRRWSCGGLLRVAVSRSGFVEGCIPASRGVCHFYGDSEGMHAVATCERWSLDAVVRKHGWRLVFEAAVLDTIGRAHVWIANDLAGLGLTIGCTQRVSAQISGLWADGKPKAAVLVTMHS